MNDAHTVTVLQDDIDHATPGSTENCPIALAAKRDLGADWVRAGCLMLTALRDGGEEIYQLPREATEFVCRFDQHRPVQPFKFEIRPPALWYNRILTLGEKQLGPGSDVSCTPGN